MQVIYATEKPPETFHHSMFLAGPSPRDPRHPNWRIEALQILEELGYNGVVFIPLPRDGQWNHSYIDQVDWESRYLEMADLIVFWIPRDLTVIEDVPAGASAERAMKLPAFTTNIEFGLWLHSGKAILGSPADTKKNRYLEHHARTESVPMADSLRGVLSLAVEKLGSGAERTGGERDVPLYIWELPHFQKWGGGRLRANVRGSANAQRTPRQSEYRLVDDGHDPRRSLSPQRLQTQGTQLPRLAQVLTPLGTL